MTDSIHSTILRRMTGQQTEDAADGPLTSSRAIKLALTKAANDTIGLVLTVTSMAEEEVSLDQLLDGLDDGLMLVGLERDGALAGLMALDMQFRAAILEMQTVGKLIPMAAEGRPATGTDKTMCDLVLSHFLTSLPAAIAATEFDGWVDGIKLTDQIASSRAAGLVLGNRDYRILRLNVDLGVAEREGELLIALPTTDAEVTAVATVVDDLNWDAQFNAAVSNAPAALDALLHRFDLPLSKAQTLKVDEVLPLAGCTVNSIRLMSSDGQVVAQAKLGQLGGMRAVRVEQAPTLQLAELGQGALPDGPDPRGLASDPLALEPDLPMQSADDGLPELGTPDPMDIVQTEAEESPLDLDFPAIDAAPLSMMDET